MNQALRVRSPPARSGFVIVGENEPSVFFCMLRKVLLVNADRPYPAAA
jgi:hypothetical protein